MPNHPPPIVLERTCHAPAHLVWKALTDIDLLKQWLPFFPDFQAKIGFETRFRLGPNPDHQYEHICRVTEVVDQQKLTYTWYYAGYPGQSLVTFELIPQDGQTKIILTHTITEPFPENQDFSLANFQEGWTYTIDGLKQFAEQELAHV